MAELQKPAPRSQPVVTREALIQAFGVVHLENILFDNEINTLADAILALHAEGAS